MTTHTHISAPRITVVLDNPRLYETVAAGEGTQRFKLIDNGAFVLSAEDGYLVGQVSAKIAAELAKDPQFQVDGYDRAIEVKPAIANWIEHGEAQRKGRAGIGATGATPDFLGQIAGLLGPQGFQSMVEQILRGALTPAALEAVAAPQPEIAIPKASKPEFVLLEGKITEGELCDLLLEYDEAFDVSGRSEAALLSRVVKLADQHPRLRDTLMVIQNSAAVQEE